MSYTITSCFDWFQVVFDNISYYEEFCMEHGKPRNYNELDHILRILEIPEKFYKLMGDIKTGLHGFKYRIQIYEGINLFLFGPKNKDEKYTTLLQFTGRGSAYLTEHNIWYNLFKYLISINAKWTRLDPATDIRGEYPLTIYTIYKCVRKKHYKSIFKKDYTIIGNPPDNEEEAKIVPLTIYAGSRGNGSSFVRAYNKAVEQGLDPISDPWLRIEMQIQDTVKINCIIHAFLLAYENKNINLFNCVVLGTLQDFLTLTDEDGNPLDVWQNLLNDIGAVKLFASPKSKNSFDIKEAWLEKCGSRVLAMLYLVYGQTNLEKKITDLALNYLTEIDRETLNIVNSKMYSLGFSKDHFNIDDIVKLAVSELKLREK